MGTSHPGPSLEALERKKSFKQGIGTASLSDVGWTRLVYKPRAQQMSRRVYNGSQFKARVAKGPMPGKQKKQYLAQMEQLCQCPPPSG